MFSISTMAMLLGDRSSLVLLLLRLMLNILLNLYIVTKEVIWCRRLLADLGCAQIEPTIIYTNSQSALRLAMNPKLHAHTKHIDIKYHYTKERILLQSIRLHYVKTNDQIGDILMKPNNSKPIL